MTAAITPFRTEAESALSALFAARNSVLPGAAKVRAAAMAEFTRMGLPHRRVEAWHYTDLRAAMRDVAPVRDASQSSRDAAKSWLRANPIASGAARIVLLDGAYQSDLSDLAALPKGVSVNSLAALLQTSDELLDAIMPAGLGTGDAVVELNTALMQDGFVLDVVVGVKAAAPIIICSLQSGGASQSVTTRSLVRVANNASLSLVETGVTLASATIQSNAALVFAIGDHCTVEHVARVSALDPASLVLDSVMAELGSHSRFASFALVKDGGLVRRQTFARLSGEHSRVEFSGLSLLDGKRHADMTLVVDHIAPHCVSREVFKTILDDESTGVFQGKVVVRQKAQKTDGGMKSRTLVLSDNASMNNKPELEIFADDVVCGHGATVGQLDQDQLFYLMARGLPRAEAEALLIGAFAYEVLDEVSDETLRASLHDDVAAWLAARKPRAKREAAA